MKWAVSYKPHVKRTTWLKPHIKPVRIGLYERKYPNGTLVMCWWDGTAFLKPGLRPDLAPGYKYDEYSDWQDFPWRGKALQFTEWYKKSQKPVRKGFYERDWRDRDPSPRALFVDWWNGKYWRFDGPQGYRISTINQKLQWRGLLK